MSNSSLVSKTILTNVNYNKGRSGKKIKKITIHHCAGIMSVETIGSFFKNGSREVSAHYGIGNDGRIGQYVDEKNTAWTDGNWESNCTSVTIETSNNKTGGQWTVSDKALNSLIKLVADIAYRNNLGTLVKGKNLTWHSMYCATACPGNYLRSKMDYICKEANKINADKTKSKKKYSYTLGDYKTLSVRAVMKGAGSSYGHKKVKDLTKDGKQNATSKNLNDKAYYKTGTIFTAMQIKKNSFGNYWAKTPSGWICLGSSTVAYVKKM